MCKFALLLSLSLAVSAMAKNVLLMNRIGPSKSELYVANADGTGEHKLHTSAGFDYHASYSYDGQWIVFTSERSGYGQADIYRVHPDGTGLERLTDDPALDDQGVLSPGGSQVALRQLVSTLRIDLNHDAEGRGKRKLTDSHSEDAMPCFVPKARLHETEAVNSRWDNFRNI